MKIGFCYLHSPGVSPFMIRKIEKLLLSLLLIVASTLISTETLVFACTGPGGESLPASQCGAGAGGGGTRGGGSGNIFNRNSGGWTATGWGNGGGGGLGGAGGVAGGGLGGLFGSRFYVGRGAFGVGGPGGGVQVGGGVISGGTGANGGFGGGFNNQINAAACTILQIPMGSFGALVMAFAGIIAIVSGALGAYKMALSTIVVGAGSWILFPVVSMFFPVNCGF